MHQSGQSLKVLVAPLDWGLGHATRCIPVIQQLLEHGCEVMLAAEGKTAILLQQEFPLIQLLHLPGYGIEYASSEWGLAAKIVAQIPKLLAAIKQEHTWLKKVVEEEKIDAVISDNRYGLYHAGIHTVFLTHQLRIKAPVSIAEDFLQETVYNYIENFSECWVPDAAGENNLAGDLSHPSELPTVPLHYVGTLSRFTERQTATVDGHLLVLLSGPEPQRTLLENTFLEELKSYTKPVVLTRGLPGENDLPAVAENITVFNHLPAAELGEKIAGASFVIARCGYSTVMDLAVLKKRSILIPTPGQTEQLYLAKHLMQKNFALCIEQKKFRLKQALSLAESFSYRPNHTGSDRLQPAVFALTQGLKERKKSK